MKILVIDIGGSHVKFKVSYRKEIRRFRSSKKLTAPAAVRKILDRTSDWHYDAVSIGFPGWVLEGRAVAEPPNLGSGWVKFDFSSAFKRPVRIVNDAAMQALGSYSGKRMLFLGLGTGMGSTLITGNGVVSLELGELRDKKKRRISDVIGTQGYARLGAAKWRKVVLKTVAVLRRVFVPDYIVVGGGKADELGTLLQDVRRGNNRNAFTGGIRRMSPMLAGRRIAVLIARAHRAYTVP